MKYVITTAVKDYKPVIVMHCTGAAQRDHDPIVGEHIEVNGMLEKGQRGEIVYVPKDQMYLYPLGKEDKWKAYFKQQANHISELLALFDEAERSLQQSSLPVCSNPNYCSKHKVLYISETCVLCIIARRKKRT